MIKKRFSISVPILLGFSFFFCLFSTWVSGYIGLTLREWEPIFFFKPTRIEEEEELQFRRRKEEWRGRSSRLMDGPSVFFPSSNAGIKSPNLFNLMGS
jgi:hypothetical protein